MLREMPSEELQARWELELLRAEEHRKAAREAELRSKRGH